MKSSNALIAFMLATATSYTGSAMLPTRAGSLTVFSVASEYCEKRELGMGMQSAMSHAMNYVRSNSLFDPDYNLPNFSKLVAREIYEQCPQYLNK